MILERTLTLLSIAMLPLGTICCGMDAVATGDPSASGAPGAGGRPAAGDAGATGAAANGIGKGDGAAASEAPTTIIVGVGSGSVADAGGLAICRASGATCSVGTDCCPGLSCTGEDEERHCD